MTPALLAGVVVAGLLLAASLRRRGTLTRRRAAAIIGCAALATLVVESDAAARRIAVQRATEVLDGCVSLGDANLDLGSFPVAARALRGHLDNVTVDADTVDISGLRLRDLQGRVHRVRYELLGSLDDVDVERASVSVRANAALTSRPHMDFGQKLLKELVKDLKPGRNGSFYCDSTGRSITYSWNESLQVETTALVSLALMKSQEDAHIVKGTLQWLSAQKNHQGQWPTTQATVLAMRALIRGTGASLGGEDCKVNISLNGEALKPVHITKANSEVMRLISLTKHLKPGRNQLAIYSEPATDLNCQIAGGYWTGKASDHTTRSTPASSQSLAIDVRYDRANLGANEELKCHVKVQNHTGIAVPMAIIDLGIPPGFDVEADDFDSLRLQLELAKFEIKGNQVVLYLRELKTDAPYEFTYILRPRYPLKVSAPVASVYEYYNPKNRAESRSVELQVTR